VTITQNIEKTTHTTREIAETQRESYEALAENFASIQRRNVELAQEGLKFLRLQEENVKATQEWFANGVKLMKLQQRNVSFAQSWTSDGAEVLRDQTEHNLRTAEVFAQSARKQQENFRALAEEWTGAYRNFFSPFSYAQKGLKTAQEATKQGLEATQQAVQQGLRLAEETTEQAEKAIRETQEATYVAELRATVHSALKTADYNELNVEEEVSKKLNGLSAEELKKVREFEKRNKNRETILEQIDRKIKATS